MLVDTIKKRIMAAMKAKNDLEKEVLRVALGDIQTEEARGTEITDAYCEKVLKKLVKSNRETLANVTDAAQRATLEQEIVILESLLPKTLSPEEIAAQLAPVHEQIRAAGNDGQATGVAMKHLKGAGIAADGKDVAAAVKSLRS